MSGEHAPPEQAGERAARDARPRPPAPSVEERTEGGEPVCWLPMVCFECGRMREDPSSDRCEHCGALSDT